MEQRLLWTFLLVCLWVGLSAQIPSNSIGNNPSGQKWKQINYDKVQVVFPEGQEASGLRVAQLVDYLWTHDTTTIGNKRQKVSIFLQGERTLSNGLVTVGPFRSEFYQSPPQFANSTTYLDLLAIHEYRHIEQFTNATQGITKLVKNVLGSWAWGGMIGLALPRWYFEGDAVISETANTKSGRGRLPFFNMQYYSWFDAEKNYSYEKAAAGSLKDYVPDWYPLGYNMLTYGREHYGADIWNKVTSDAVRYKGLFVPFAKGIKRHTGLSTQQLYAASMEDAKRRWNETIEGAVAYKQRNTKNKNVVTNYSIPTPWKGSVIVEKIAFDQIAAYYRIDKSGAETKIVEHGILLDGNEGTLSIANGKMCWAELGFDPRWRYKQWSNIFVYDLLRNEKKQLTNKSKYFSPAYSNDGSRIATIEVLPNLTQKILILNATDGSVIDEWKNSEGLYLNHPVWSDENNIVVVASQEEMSQIISVDIATKKYIEVTKPAVAQITHPFVHDQKVYFSASFEEVNNVYRVALSGGEIEKMTNSRVGAFQPSVTDDEQLLFSEFSSEGYNISTLNLKEAEVHLFEMGSEHKKGTFKTLEAQEASSILTDLPEKEFEIKKFNKWSGLIRPHSIIPEWQDPLFNIRVLSDNKFSTLSAEVGASFNYNEDEWTYYAGLRYAELYPIINASFAKSNRSALILNFQELNDSSFVQTNFVERWSENRVTGGVTLPYNFSKGNMSNNMSLRANYQYATIDVEGRFDDPELQRDTAVFAESFRNEFSEVYKEPLQDGSISTLDIGFSFSMIQRKAVQHLQPRLGLVLFSRWRKNIANNDIGGDVFFIGGDLFLPGFAKTHNFYINTFYQRESMLDNYRYGDFFDYPRGYNISLRRDNFFKVGFNYSFPIEYPDLAIGGMAFLKRIKANAFLDLGSFGISSFPFQQSSENLNSAGIELGVDFRAFRLVEIDVGLRYSYLMNPGFSNNRSRHQFDFFTISITQ